MIKIQSHKINIEEWVEARIWEGEELKEIRFFKGNTITATGKTEIAELVGGLDTNTIDVIWAKINGTMTSEASSNSRAVATLSVTTGSAYTVPGTYSAIFTGNAGLGSGSYYNSIGIDIELTPGAELDFTVKWVFSGAHASDYGNQICASVLGKIGDQFDYPLSSFAIYQGAVQNNLRVAQNVVNDNTLTVTSNTPFPGAETFDVVRYITSRTDGNRFFDRFNGFTITIESGDTVDVTAYFVFG